MTTSSLSSFTIESLIADVQPPEGSGVFGGPACESVTGAIYHGRREAKPRREPRTDLPIDAICALSYQFLPMDEQTRGRIQGVIDNNDIVLFMKGNPEASRCGFS